MIKLRSAMSAIVLCVATTCSTLMADTPVYRPPSVPLVVNNPFLSIWSPADKLTDVATEHWTKHRQALTSLIRIDGQAYRLMGNRPDDVAALPQTLVQVLPTRTIYQFEGANVHVTLTFTTPTLPTDVDVLSRPLTYLTWDVKSTDGKAHAVSVLFGASGELAVDSTDQKVEWKAADVEGYTALRIGTPDQPLLVRNGDDSRIDWGYAYIAAAKGHSTGAIGAESKLLQSFASSGALPTDVDSRQPRAVKDEMPTLALAIDFGQVSGDVVSRRAMIEYDDIYAIDFFGHKCRGFWRNKPGMNGEKLLIQADKEYDAISAKCKSFDENLTADLKSIGGDDYAYMCALAYRQSLGACGVAADSNGQPMLFTKEQTSNGNMATVDVIFPMDPVLIALSPTLAKASLAPVFTYSASPRWKWPNAPHDLGEYPICFGRDDGGESMPVEESGNMIILADAVSQEEGNTKFVDQYWPLLTQWAKYLEKFGLDPEEQLCTDDFKGRLAHNANLSVKAIVALAAYGDMARMKGDTASADRYLKMAKTDAEHWIKVDSEGDHFKLAFDKPNTWGQNYNMVWDKILHLNVFPADIYKKQIEFFKTKMQPYGLPLDNRNTMAKTDWSTWTSAMADNEADFEALTSPLITYLNTTTARLPFVDGYFTDDIHKDFFHARPVIGGVFIRMLTDSAMWKKWAGMDHETTGKWAPLPLAPIINEVIPTSAKRGIQWAFTTSKPADDWFAPTFDDSKWQKRQGPFGHDVSEPRPRTDWHTDDIWIRRDFNLGIVPPADVKFSLFHDEDAEIYINGVLAGSVTGFNTAYQPLEMNAEGKKALKQGKNQFAVHCHQTIGGQFIDVGLVTVTEREASK